MNRRIFKFLVFTITILFVNLLSNLITDYFLQYKDSKNIVRFTIIGMGVIVLIFYPAFEYINGIVERITSRLLKKGKNIFGRILGVYIAFALLLFILFLIYAHIWFHVGIFQILF